MSDPVVPSDTGPCGPISRSDLDAKAREAVVANAVYAAHRDFVVLTKTIERILACAGTSDQEFSARLTTARDLAKRGSVLCKQLVALSRKRRGLP